MAEDDYVDPICPTCSTTLVLKEQDGAPTWQCATGHGMFVNLASLYEVVQLDEIDVLWKAAQAAGPGPRMCPITGTPMRQVTISVDADEEFDNTAGTAIAGAPGTVTLDVSLDTNGVWLDDGELQQISLLAKDQHTNPVQRLRGMFGRK